METISDSDLGRVVGGSESFADVRRAISALPSVPVSETKQQTMDFIAQHPFFHQGVMDLPIGGGKHFRNVPFVGPGRIIGGALHGDGTEIRRGIEVTRGTWAAK